MHLLSVHGLLCNIAPESMAYNEISCSHLGYSAALFMLPLGLPPGAEIVSLLSLAEPIMPFCTVHPKASILVKL